MNRDYGKKSSSPTAVRKMAGGGIVDGFKKLGERLSEGSIDDPGSVAYWRYGEGKQDFESGTPKSTLESNNTPAPAPEPASAPTTTRASVAMNGRSSADEDVKFSSDDYEPGKTTEGAAMDAKPAATAPKRAARMVAAKPAQGFAGGLASGYSAAETNKAVKAEAAAAPAPAPAPASANTKYQSSIADSVIGRSVKGVGDFLSGAAKAVGDTVSGIVNSKSSYTPENYEEGRRRLGEQIRNKTRNTAQNGASQNLAKGGMVGNGRDYGKKC